MVKVVRASQAELEAAVDALRDGELVAFPTETVYGLGANASNPAAVRKVFELKDRPPSHPVIVHIDQQKYLKRWVRELSPEAEKLAEAFWPGPLTLVLPRAEAEAIADAAIARQERGERNQARVKAGEKLGDISGATKMVLDALAQKG